MNRRHASQVLMGLVLAATTTATAAQRARGFAIAERRPDPGRQPGGLDARVLRESRHPHAQHRPAGGAGDAFHPRLQPQRRLLADAGEPADRPDPVAARGPQLPRGERGPDGPGRLLHDRRVPVAARDPGGCRLHLRAVGQVAPRRQRDAAGGLHLLDHDAPRPYRHVLRRRGHRGGPGPEGAGLPDRPVDRSRRAVPRREPRPALLPVPRLQRPLQPGREPESPGSQPARGGVRRRSRCCRSPATGCTPGRTTTRPSSTTSWRCDGSRPRPAASTTASARSWPPSTASAWPTTRW